MHPWLTRLAPLAPVVVLVACASATSGCSSSGATDPGEVSETPAAVVTSESGGYRISMHTAPDAVPSRGVNTLRMNVTRISDGAPATGLALEVVPWMPAMGHGASVKPTIEPGSAPGSYMVSNVNLFMPGLWEIRTTIAGPSSSDHVAPQFEIH